MLNSEPQIPVNVTLFGKRVFADVIKLRRGHTGLEWAINPITVVFIRRGRFRDRHIGKKASEDRDGVWSSLHQ